MRNLKKILALVLALMMVVSMMVTASATTFVDDADIDAKYAEAVSVLSGIGVIRGLENEDGSFSFQPKGNLNRAQAATIIAYVLKGNLDGIDEEVSVYENPFTDVAEWAVPYVLFAHSRGIIVGRNANTYDPNATITGYELGKMLLIAAGLKDEKGNTFTNASFVTTVYVVDGKAYAEEAEAMVASLNAGGAAITTKTIAKSDWQVSVAKGLKHNNIWDNEFVLSKKLTREEACFLAFETVVNSTIADDVFDLTHKADVDEFGRTTKVWYSTATEGALKNWKIALDDHAAPAVLVVDAKDKTANAAGISALLGLTGKKVLADVEGGAEVYLNGDKQDSAINFVIGDTVEYYVDKDGKVAKIVIIRESLEKATSEKIESGTNAGKYTWSFGSVAETVAAKDAYTKDAYYLVVANEAKELLNVAAPTLINKAKVAKADNLTLSDATYVVVNDQKLVKAGEVAISGDFKTEFDFALNSNGYLIGVAAAGTYVKVETPDEYEGETGYAYLVKAEKQIITNDAGSSLIGGSTAYSWDVIALAQLAMPDGTFAVVNLTTKATDTDKNGKIDTLVINGGEPSTDVDKDDAPVAILDGDDGITGKFVKYTIQEDGTYTLAALTDTTTVELIKGVATIGTNLFATNATVWTHYEINTKTGITTTTKTGLSGYPAAVADGVGTQYIAVVTPSKTNGKIVTEFVTFSEYKAPVVENTVENAYYVGTGEYTAKGLTYEYYVNGTKTSYYADESAVPTEKGIYTLTLDKDGKITKVEDPELIKDGKVNYVDNDMFILEDGSVFFFYKTKTYNVSTGHTGETDTIAVGDEIVFTYIKYYEKDEPVVIYITTEKK